MSRSPRHVDPTNTTLQQLQSRVQAALRHGRRMAVEPMGAVLVDVQTLLEALPLSTEEYAAARCRLENTQRYLALAECGAACYELRLLERGLRQSAMARPTRPHR